MLFQVTKTLRLQIYFSVLYLLLELTLTKFLQSIKKQNKLLPTLQTKIDSVFIKM